MLQWGTDMKRYFKLLWLFIKTSVIREMEFRSGFFSLTAVLFLSTFITVAFFSVLYGSVTSIHGWSYGEALFLLGTYFLVDNLTSALFYRNFSRVSDYINEGNLDLLLTKPVDPQFTMTTRYTGVSDLLNVVTSFIIMGVALGKLHLTVTFFGVVGYLSLILLAIAIVYSMWLAVSLLSFWLTQIDDLQDLWSGFYEFAKYPPDIFFGPARLLFTFAIPILTIVAFPAEFILHRVGPSSILVNLAIAVILLTITRIFWNIGLRRYGSASS